MKRMFNVVVVAAAMLVAAAGAHAAVKSQVGVKGGISIQKLGGDDADSDQLDSRTGFVGGGYYQADFSTNFGVRIEALYFMKGAKADSAGIELTVKLDYIEFPVLAMAHVPVSDNGRISFFAGPTLGFNTNAELEASYAGLSASVDFGDAIKSFEFGLTFGAGLSFDVGSVCLGIDGRYGLGLTSIADIDFFGDAGVQDPDIKNRGFAVMALVGFPIGSK